MPESQKWWQNLNDFWEGKKPTVGSSISYLSEFDFASQPFQVSLDIV